MICELYMYITIHIISFSFIIFAYIFESVKKKSRLSHDWHEFVKVIKGAKIRDRYNQVPHLTQDTNGKVTNSQ